jgi:parvulin-like peptidyl-prolyl isomerase
MAKIPTRKHLARAEKDRRFRIALIITSATIAVLVVGLVGYGLLRTRLIEPTQPVAVVNGQEISTADFQSRVRFAQLNLLNQIQSYEQVLQFLGADDPLAASYQQQLDNAITQLNTPLALGSQVISQMIEDLLIEEEATRRGLHVSEEDIDLEIAAAFGYFPLGTPTPQATATQFITTAESATTQTPAVISTITDPTPVVSQGTPTALPSPTPYTEEAFRANLQRYLDSLVLFEIDEAALRAQARAQLYLELLQNEFEDTVPQIQEQISARHILVETEDEAIEILLLLEGGEEWESLAAEFSIDESNKDDGGNLGWFPRGVMVDSFEESAFAAEVGMVTGPIETAFGWHLIEVLDRAERELETPIFQQTVFREFQDWLQARREESEISLPDYWVTRIPDLPGGSQ